MEDINLHFTGDFAAIEKANNLLAALIDNNLQSKTNSLGMDARTVRWKRVMDIVLAAAGLTAIAFALALAVAERHESNPSQAG